MLKYLFIILVVFSSTASARMYQWVDPESGSTQLSGKPPMWYRSAEKGPRVFVFENSRVIDDTNIEVSDSEREKLRQEAFLQAEKDREKAKQKLMEARRLDAELALKNAPPKGSEEPLPEIIEDPIEEDMAEMEKPPEPSGDEDATMEAMKKLIADWEKVQTDRARNVLQQPADSPQ